MQVVHQPHYANTVPIQLHTFQMVNFTLVLCPFNLHPWVGSISFLDPFSPYTVFYVKRSLWSYFHNLYSPDQSLQPLFLYQHSLHLFASSIIKTHFLHWLSTSVTGAFSHSATWVSVAVSVSTRKLAEAWGTCLISHSVQNLGFEPRFVYSICYISYFQKEWDPKKPTHNSGEDTDNRSLQSSLYPRVLCPQ